MSETTILLPRRSFLSAAGHTTLSAGAVLLLAGCGTQQSAHAADPAADADIMNSALGAEQEAIAAYQVGAERSEEHTSELQSLMRISYGVFCLKKKKQRNNRRY